ncbi:serine/threonine-protein phosphatase 7 long form homolog isoform X2 [Chenopodium quinoa]|uniref:serine/threonine-protein phosphatase 7 long form homolog isoform X2 n=2 Tax=Chenopodium quinoa TaxID=63459 RepID=UPI000B781FF8|nr:serine/threonine-protein phosphatase 7 long form homolog isoform X2 [Chenopodium quinoa]XP_021758776.1 serine/threonine-protein phosphatase 7 long form homolog isoform X2 [Chenopodium quinoa]
MEPVIRPGPVDPSVLRLQTSHRSHDVWSGVADRVLSVREHMVSVGREWRVDGGVLEYVRLAGFYGVHRILGGGFLLDRSLLTALVERWRQETHTFHLVVGEATITLQDVSVLLGLRVHGPPVIGPPFEGWHDLVEELLGVRPGHDDNGKPFLEGSTLKLTWLRRHFSQMPEGADDLTVQRHSRAYILTLMGSILFADKSGDAVSLYYLPFLRDWGTASTYSWGSATLGFLYRQLCRGCQRDSRQIGGPLILLQLWSWEHITIGRPYIRRPRDPPQEDPEAEDEDDILGTQHQRGVDPLACRWLRVHLSCAHTASGLPYYRDAFDHQREDQMIWQPYTEAVMDRLPEICRSDMHIWRSRAPLICFDVVEFHLPDRVLRQFGLDQPIPQDVDTDVALHRKDRRGQRNWEIRHSDHVHEWSRREALVVQGYPFTGTSSPAMTEYMAWYRRITRLVITPPSQERPPSHYQPATSDLLLAHAFADLHVQLSGATETISHLPPETAIPFAIQTMQGFTSFCGQTLSRVGQSHLIQQPRPSTSSSSTVHTMPIRPPPHRGGHSARAFRPPTPSQHTIMTSPPLVHRQYQRNRRRSNTTSGVGVGLDDIPEETAASSSSSPHGKKQRPS